MNTKHVILSLSLLVAGLGLQAQTKVHGYTSGELIFSQSNAGFTQEFKDTYASAQMVGNNVRFTMFLIHM